MSTAALVTGMLLAAAGHVSPKPVTGTLVPGKNTSAMGSPGVDRTQDPNSGDLQPTDIALAQGRGFADCMVKSHPRDVAQLLIVEDEARFPKFASRVMPYLESCAGKIAKNVASISFKISASTLRGLFAEAWLRQRGLPVLSSTDYDPSKPGSDWITDDAGQKAVLRMADCLAARQAERSLALLYAVPGSADEDRSFQSIMPYLYACLESNVTLKARKPAIRLALASAVERRSHASAGKN